MSREQLIIRLLEKNDDRAISMLYDDYSAALFGVVFRIVLSEEIAADVIQESFIKIWKNAQNYEVSKGTLFTWMLNICRNTAIDATRSKHFRNGKIQNLDKFVNEEIPHFEEPKIHHIGLHEQVKRLDRKYSEVIELIYFKGHTQKEVEAKLKIPLGTVKTRLKIGLRELRKVYGDILIFLFIINWLYSLI